MDAPLAFPRLFQYVEGRGKRARRAAAIVTRASHNDG